MIRKAEEQFREMQNKLNEYYAQNDDFEYEIDDPLDADETEVKAAACQPAKP